MSDTDASGGGTRDGRRSRVLTVEKRLGLLANERRRAALRYLADRPREPVPVSRLADAVETETGERALVALHHDHVPKLAAAGVVEYDAESERVRYLPHAEIEELLAFLDVEG